MYKVGYNFDLELGIVIPGLSMVTHRGSSCLTR